MKAVLDYFHLDNVTLLGISMGGWICFRAAAHEPRIRRVIALSIAFDYMQIPALPIQLLVKVLMLSRGLMDYLARLKMNANYQERWGINNLMIAQKPSHPWLLRMSCSSSMSTTCIRNW